LTTEVLLWTIRRMAVGLGLVLVLLGVAMLVNFERHRCVAAETVPPTSHHSDEMAGAAFVVFGIAVLIGEVINRT
jgi:hypothetical protein